MVSSYRNGSMVVVFVPHGAFETAWLSLTCRGSTLRTTLPPPHACAKTSGSEVPLESACVGPASSTPAPVSPSTTSSRCREWPQLRSKPLSGGAWPVLLLVDDFAIHPSGFQAGPVQNDKGGPRRRQVDLNSPISCVRPPAVDIGTAGQT